MLTLTDEAVTAIRALTARPDVSEGAGLRISSAAAENGSVEVVAALSAGPAPSDHVVEAADVTVYVDVMVVPVVEDKILDAETTNEGQVRFDLLSVRGIDDGTSGI
ncbi:Fe-S cluster assembly protein HesB [Phytoactinopolyspora limicola]|uniref:Fe-S cluster assembly protein HesB n=1 Tax=Phytoactinopolyspora limicola TaxID=2715536 RepID=UPI001407CCC6|nr:Fe-S cluster assembly protein HesB [Phytoactinopolyspora limicola]